MRLPLLLSLLMLCACSDSTDVVVVDGDTPPMEKDGFTPPPVADVAVFDAAPPPEDIGPVDPCDPDPCQRGEVCVTEGELFRCDPAECETLECADTERCVATEGGALCEDNTCDNDLECPEDRWCDEGVCAGDVCAAGQRRCEGEEVLACEDNGGALAPQGECGSPAEGFLSLCIEDFEGEAACTCRDEWDCPAFQTCEGERCRGQSVAPSCRLEPTPFSESLPAPEIVWGGTAASVPAEGSPFPDSAQAVMTPVVIDLDGEGTPEIVFMTFCNSIFNRDGVLRAIYGGGDRKGQDAFAVLAGAHWQAGDPLPEDYDCTDADLDPTSALAAGDLDDPATTDGRPEIVVLHEGNGVVIFDHTGARVAEAFVGDFNPGGNPSIAIANVDQRGPAEIIIGRSVFTVARDAEGGLELVDHFEGDLGKGTNGQGAIGCVADLLGDSRLEIIGGGTVYSLPEPPAGATRQADCAGNGGAVDPANEAEEAWCAGSLVVEWDARDVNGADAAREGFCAVADILGADQAAAPGPDNLLDGVPELILVVSGQVQVYNGQTGVQLRTLRPGLGRNGGAPNVDDFDGDGFPEIGSAFESGYTMLDLQDTAEACPEWPEVIGGNRENPPRDPGGACSANADCATGATCNLSGFREVGQCVCLHSGWARRTEDDSSRVTGSTLFDFNGDGAAEVIYNDECWFRVYDGGSGEVLFEEPSESRTRIEHPIVADVDNDGNAEIVFTVSNESGFCSERSDAAPPPLEGQLRDHYNNGLEVWGDPNDRWVSVRRIWNQHAYHVTHVLESGGVPTHEPRGWLDHNDRSYNSYRAQPRTFGVAPDLVVDGLQTASPNGCERLEDSVVIDARVRNQGDLRVGQGILVGFEGTWGEETRALESGGAPLTVTLNQGLAPGESLRLSVRYDADERGLPDTVTARIDVPVDGGPEFGQERECEEDNNAREAPVEAPVGLADLVIVSLAAEGGVCPEARFTATVRNDGTLEATDVLLRFEGGGGVLAETTIERLGPGASTEVTVDTNLFPSGREIAVRASVDPEGAIAECDEGNNERDAAPIACLIP